MTQTFAKNDLNISSKSVLLFWKSADNAECPNLGSSATLMTCVVINAMIQLNIALTFHFILCFFLFYLEKQRYQYRIV
jgi:hypothetical protein